MTTAADRAAPAIPYVDRETFFANTWDYRVGEHITIIGYTGSGKTTLSYQLMQHTTSREMPGLVFVMKPRDKTATTWNKRLGYRLVRTWPPVLTRYQPLRPPGWTLWPKHTFNVRVDDENMRRIFGYALHESYKHGDRLINADEAAGLAKDLHLGDELRAIWTRGRSMGVGLLAATQRPVDIPVYAYSAAEHLFLAYERDEYNRKRFAEIGGVDKKLVADVVLGLRQHEWLYIRREDRAMCIIGP